MTTLTGGKAYDTYNKTWVDWRPVAGVVDEYDFIAGAAGSGYVCLGVVGNREHWAQKNGQDHTARATGSMVVNGRTLFHLPGWVYAIDAKLPDQGKFEGWYLDQLRAGRYPQTKYFNINGRHWSREAVSGAGTPFAWATESSDHHWHNSWMPGAEYSRSTILADYDVFRRTGTTPIPAPRPPSSDQDWVAERVRALPVVRAASTGVPVKMVQGLLTAGGYSVPMTGTGDATTITQLAEFQVNRRVANSVFNGRGDGVCGPQTWRALLPERLSTVYFGHQGHMVRVVQGLLSAHGYVTAIDGQAGKDTIAKMKAFQVWRNVANSVVSGRGDGIGGPATLKALLTV